MQLLVNGVSFGLLIAVAYTVAWFKATPWKRRPAPTLVAAPIPVAAARSETERPEIVGPVRIAKAAS
jgi:hypothetical protein